MPKARLGGKRPIKSRRIPGSKKKPNATDKEIVSRKEVLSDFGEILNNIDDDLEMDKTGEEGHATYKEVVEAIEKYTRKVILEKYKKYGGK